MLFKREKRHSACCEGIGMWRIWAPEKGPEAPAVDVNHWWETQDRVTPFAVHVWLYH